MRLLSQLKLVLVAPALGLLLTFSCCDDPEPNACKDVTKMQGRFSIYEHLQVAGRDSLLVSDTVLTNNPIVFAADTDYVSYEWRIADDPRVFNTKQVSLTFANPQSNISIMLIAKWNKNVKCFPQDDGVDTVVHFLTVVNQEKHEIIGAYSGADQSSPTDLYTVEIKSSSNNQKLILLNLNEGCDPVDPAIGVEGFYNDVGYKKMLFVGYYVNACKNPEGVVTVAPNNDDIRIDYTVGNATEENGFHETIRTPDVFLGKKEN
jgi:hypothetical protein